MKVRKKGRKKEVPVLIDIEINRLTGTMIRSRRLKKP